MRVAAGADRVRQQHPIQPAMNDAVAGPQRHAAATGNEIGQIVVSLHIHRLGISGGVAERLHHQIGGETEAGEIFQLVAGHRASGVLRTDRSHLRLAVGARTDAGNATRLAHHLLRQGEALAGTLRRHRTAEDRGGAETHDFPRPIGQSTPDDQVNASAGLHLVQQHIGLVVKGGDHFAVFLNLAGIGVDVDDIAHLHLAHIAFNRQRASVFLSVEEDRRDLAAQTVAAVTLVRHEGNVIASPPQH